MSDLKVKGKLIHVLELQTGTSQTGKDWQKKDFVIETEEGQFSKKVAFTLFGDKVDLIKGKKQNDELEVHFNLESREHNGRWFANVNAWKINVINSSTETQPPGDEPKDLPF